MKKFIGIALIAVAALTAGWNFSQSQNEVELTDLALANVEALARGESGKECHTSCCQTRYDACLDALHALGCSNMHIYLYTSC